MASGSSWGAWPVRERMGTRPASLLCGGWADTQPSRSGRGTVGGDLAQVRFLMREVLSMTKRVKDFRPAVKNANRHTARGMGMIATSMSTDGYGDPMLAAADGEMISGSARLETAAQVFGVEVEPLVVHSDGTRPVIHVRDDIPNVQDKRAQRLALAANRASQVDLSWDVSVIAGLDADILDGLFTPAELSDLGQQWADEQAAGQPVSEDPGAQVDKAAELQEKWNVALGDIWTFDSGKGYAHRLICGDCTDAATVARVMAGEKAALCFTSPPYAKQRDYTQEILDWDALMQGMAANLPMKDNGQVLVNLGLVHSDKEWQPYWDGWIAWMRDNGWLRFGWYVWDKLCALPGDHGGRLAPAHEFVFHFCKQPIAPNKNIPTINAGRIVYGHNRQKDGRLTRQTGYGDAVQDFRIPDSVFRRGAEKGAHGIDHPAVMSANFAEMAVDAYPGELVFDPFAGSGTTGVACERLGRKARMIEIAPAYCAVILERMRGLGLTPTRQPAPDVA